MLKKTCFQQPLRALAQGQGRGAEPEERAEDHRLHHGRIHLLRGQVPIL
jgi:hypothetical protein